MPLPDFDPTKHHIGLGPEGGQQHGFVIGGAYRADPQKAPVTREFGGQTDLLERTSLARWTMDDFSGGIRQEVWGEDSERIWDSLNVIPSQLGSSPRTIPPLIHWGLAQQDDLRDPLGVFHVESNKISVVWPTTTSYYDVDTGAKTSVNTSSRPIEVACKDPAEDFIYGIANTMIGDAGHPGYLLRRWKKDDANATTVDAVPDKVKGVPKGIQAAGTYFLAQFGNTLWMIDVNDDADDAKWINVGRLPGHWQDSCIYNGLTYILVSTWPEQETAVVAYDGAQILPIVSFPYNFTGKQIVEYGGRIYVGGHGRDTVGNAAYVELHEITSSSQQLIYNFSEEHGRGLNPPHRTYAMVVHEGLLFIGTDQPHLLVYDQTRDGLWRGPEVKSSPGGFDLATHHLFSSRQRLWAWCYEDTDTAHGFYRLAVDNADLSGGSYESKVETSQFQPEPGMNKRWSELRVLTRGQAASAEWSLDGGQTWTALTGSTVQSGDLYETTFDLDGVSRSIRLRFTITKTGVSASYLPLGFTLAFAILDTGKESWQFSVLAADNVEGVDEASVLQDIQALHDTLKQWKAEGTYLDYTDLHGNVHTVYVSDLREDQPVIGPADVNGSREAFYSVSLMEV